MNLPRLFICGLVVSAIVARASVSVSVDILSAGDGQLPPTSDILCIDVLVDVSDGDSWTAGGLIGQTYEGVTFRYAVDPNTATPILTDPTTSNRFVTFVSKPRGRDANIRYTNSGAGVAGRYCPSGPYPPTTTPTDLDVVWFATPPELPDSPTVDGAVFRIALDIGALGVPPEDFLKFEGDTEPPGTVVVFRSYCPVEQAGGTVCTTFDVPVPQGLSWGVAYTPLPEGISVSVDILSEGDGQLPPTPDILCVDVHVDVPDGDSWTAAGLRGETYGGVTLRYAGIDDPNTPHDDRLFNPGTDNRFSTFFTKPRTRDGAGRYTNAGATVAGRYCPTGSIETSTTNEVNIAWFASPPETQDSPTVDGYVCRIALDIGTLGVPPENFLKFEGDTEPPGTVVVFRSFCPTAPAGGTVCATFDVPAIQGLNWGVAYAPVPVAVVSLVPQSSGECVGADLVVDVNLAADLNMTAGQFYLSYDTTKLDLTTDDISGGQSPFTQLLLANVDDVAGTADVAVSVPAGNAGASSGRMARLSFTVVDGSCTPTANLVTFRNHVPPTRVTDSSANPYDTANGLLATNNLPPVAVDREPPMFPDAVGGVLPPISAMADAGFCTATLNVPDPTVIDDCNANVTVNGVRSDGQPLTAPYPSAAPTTITWTATDCAGNSAIATQDVSVAAVNEIEVDIAFANAAFAPTFVRCIRFEVFPRNCTAPAVVEQSVTFTLGAATGVVVQVPCGDYACITARDVRHSLRLTDNDDFGTVGTRYVANFTNRTASGGDNDALILGNLAQENGEYQYIDILDVAVLLSRYGSNEPVDSACGYPARHADVTGDGVVGLTDLTAMLTGFGQFQESNCCGRGDIAGDGRRPMEAPPGQRVEPRTAISVEELVALGYGDLVSADLNGDGIVDLSDLTTALLTAEPVPPREARQIRRP